LVFIGKLPKARKMAFPANARAARKPSHAGIAKAANSRDSIEGMRSGGNWQWTAAAVALGLAVRLAASFAIPLGAAGVYSCAPDESEHFRAVAGLRLWDGGERRPGEPVYGVFPPPPYLAQWLALRIGRKLAPDGWRSLARFQPARPEYDGYPYARLGGLFWAALTVIALCATAGHWTQRPRTVALAGLAAALYPQFAFTGAYVNGDAATIAAGALLGAALSGWAVRGEGDPGLWRVGLALGLVLIMKPNGWFSILPVSCWIGQAAWRGQISRPALAKAAAACAAAALPVLAWNARRMDGDAFGLRHFAGYLATEWAGAPGTRTPHALSRLVKDLFLSTVGDFRNLNLPLPSVLVGATWLFLATGGFLALRGATGVRRRAALCLAASLAVNLAMVLYESWFVDFQPQGRYLLPAVLWLCLAAILAPFEGRLRIAWRLGCTSLLAAGCAGMLLLLYRHPCV
jgi:hypothetical protein